jgi:hypothetical protein
MVIPMEKTSLQSPAPTNPWDDLKKLKGKALKAEQIRLSQEGFGLRFCGTESNMGELIMAIAQLTSEKAELRLIENISEIEVWAKPTQPQKTVKEVREEISPLLDPKTHRR